MAGFTKLFSSIVDSTIWRESKETKIVWITMLAKADSRGIVEAAVPGLADASRVTVDECREAMRVLSSPDPDSRSKEHEGRRIKEIDGGWQILNYPKYRAKLSADERREYMRLYMQEYRGCKLPVNNVNICKTRLAHADADADADSRSKEVPPNPHSGAGVDDETFNRTRLPIPQPPPIVTYTADCRPILAYLNQRAGMSFAEVSDNLDLIQDRLNQGITAADIRQMIDHQCAEWKGTSHEKFLRPITLFGEKFHQYFGQKGKPVVRSVNGQTRKFDGTNKLQREIDRVMKK